VDVFQFNTLAATLVPVNRNLLVMSLGPHTDLRTGFTLIDRNQFGFCFQGGAVSPGTVGAAGWLRGGGSHSPQQG